MDPLTSVLTTSFNPFSISMHNSDCSTFHASKPVLISISQKVRTQPLSNSHMAVPALLLPCPPSLPCSEIELQFFLHKYDQLFHVSLLTSYILTTGTMFDFFLSFLPPHTNHQQVLSFLSPNISKYNIGIPICSHYPNLGYISHLDICLPHNKYLCFHY